MITLNPGIFRRHDPVVDAVPVLVDVSRSGREYPPEFRSPLPFTEVHDNVSMYVEDLCAAAPEYGATLLYACFPNTFIDTNRSAADVDEGLIEGRWPGPITLSDFTQRGLGLIKRYSRYGTEMQERKLTVAELQERLATYHEPYHREIARILAGMPPRPGGGAAPLPLMSPRRAELPPRTGAADFCTATSRADPAPRLSTLWPTCIPGPGSEISLLRRSSRGATRSGERHESVFIGSTSALIDRNVRKPEGTAP